MTMCDVRKATAEDVETAFQAYGQRLSKHLKYAKWNADGIWFAQFKGLSWRIAASIHGVNLECTHGEPTIFLEIYPKLLQFPYLRFDAALINRDSPRKDEYMIRHDKFVVEILRAIKENGPAKSALANFVGEKPTQYPERQQPSRWQRLRDWWRTA